MGLIVWGAGEGYIKNKHLLNGQQYRLVDASEDKQGMVIDGVKVEHPDILCEIQSRYIIISSNLYFDDICKKLMNQYSVPSGKIIRLNDIEKELLMREIGRYKLQKSHGPKIMFGYCFLVYENCRIHDFLLAESLRLRGAEIIPVVCGGVQELQCSVYGGIWGNNTHDSNMKKVNHQQNCFKCKKCDEKVWKDWGNFDTVSAVDFVTEKEKEFARNYIQKLSIHKINDWTYEYFPIGEWALKTYFNNELISYKDEWEFVEESELRSLTYNVMIMCIASLKIVEKIQPEIIYSNDSFYYPFSILEKIANDKKIPFYNAYGYRKNTYSYAMNTSTIAMDLDSAWEAISTRKLSDEENIFIENYISNRRYGRDMMINTADPFQSVKEIKSDSVHGVINDKKKTALLATNVTWDAAALNKGIVFDKITEWVLYTIDFFSRNPEWQLIVRTHPAEVTKLIPEAQERICSIVLKKYDNRLPSNIVLIDGDAPVSVYDLLGQVDMGIVYTTTVGLEMCCYGIPTITVAKAPYRNKGFTYDPENVKDYEEYLHAFMNTTLSDKKSEAISQQAKKYFLLYYFIYMLPNPFHCCTYEEGVKLKIKSADELIQGNSSIWDYICDSILTKKAILSADRFPPYVLEV